VVLLIALGIPLTVNLQRRATTEVENQALIQAQGVASQIGPDNIDERAELAILVDEAAAQLGGRVVVVDADGTLVADSAGPGSLDEDYDTGSA
jgi:hypothetical protein